MLELRKIKKMYLSGEDSVPALKGVDLKFREHEFVAILGPSGCGKTTLLNIIGGLDHYTSGDLLINGVSTKQYADKDWDAYRNHRIGFVFQSYHLIQHLNVTENVEMSMTLAGVGAKERHQRAEQALERVGLAGQKKKRPNQMSGGQMQRVSIARAIVNDPDIILADEPTGALDSTTSVQIMEILKQISKEKLIIMVTHNAELAETYATRIIRIKDGEIVGDSNPIYEPSDPQAYEEMREDALFKKGEDRGKAAAPGKKKEKTSMAFTTALKLSLKNLMTKKVRTSITAFAGSIGIIGVSLVLAISNGFSNYITQMQTTTLAGFPIVVSEMTYDQEQLMNMSPFGATGSASDLVEYPDDGFVLNRDDASSQAEDNMIQMFQDMVVFNDLSEEYFAYLRDMDDSKGQVHFRYSTQMHMMTQNREGGYEIVSASNIGWNSLIGGEKFLDSQYDVLQGRFPSEDDPFEVVVILDKYNRISSNILKALGIDETRKDIRIEELLSSRIRFLENDAYYIKGDNGVYRAVGASDDLGAVYESAGAHPLEIVGVLRIKQGIDYEVISSGIAYGETLNNFAFSHAGQIAEDQRANKTTDVLTGKPFQLSQMMAMLNAIRLLSGGTLFTVEDVWQDAMQQLGGDSTPTDVYIFPVDFAAKADIKAYLDAWNQKKVAAGKEEEKVVYTDMAETMTQVMNEVVNIISIVLICFAAISLVVSSVMISIITYVSVVERTKEIGILRSLGARKRDIFNVFNAETVLIGFSAGVFGVVVTYLLCIPLNILINSLIGFAVNVAQLALYHALMMVAISVVLTFIAGLIPARIAARKDPVVALRTE